MPETRRRRQNTANRNLAILKAALNHCFDEGLAKSNDAWGRRLKPFRQVDGVRNRYLENAEAKRLINAADPDFRNLVRAALHTGARYGELSRMMVADEMGPCLPKASRSCASDTSRSRSLT